MDSGFIVCLKLYVCTVFIGITVGNTLARVWPSPEGVVMFIAALALLWDLFRQWHNDVAVAPVDVAVAPVDDGEEFMVVFDSHLRVDGRGYVCISDCARPRRVQ